MWTALTRRRMLAGSLLLRSRCSDRASALLKLKKQNTIKTSLCTSLARVDWLSRMGGGTQTEAGLLGRC